MQDKNFVILNIRIFLKFLEEDIALLTLQKSVLLVLSQVRKGKVNLVEKLVTAMNEELPIVTKSSSGTASNIKGYHVYQGILVPKIGETLSTESKPGNPKDKYSACVKKNECLVGHLPLGKTGNFTKAIFYFLIADRYSICEVEITGKPVSLGNIDGMQVPCKLQLTERSKFVNISQNSLKTKS